jgi:hypothetical protein
VDFKRKTDLLRPERIQILELWNKEYPEKLGYDTLNSFEQYLNNLNDQSHILMMDENQKIRGWYFDFVRKNENWFALILDSKLHGIGLGTELLNTAKKNKDELNGWVIDHNTALKENGDYYKSPLGFYLKNGFEKLAQSRLESDKISAVKIHWSKHSQKVKPVMSL